MPKLPLNPEEFRKHLADYRTASEQALRDLQAAMGEDATCPASNAFFKEHLAGRCFRRAIDLGCHNGAFSVSVLAPIADELTLVDFSAKALETALKRLPRAKGIRADLSRPWTAPGLFDLVSLCEVIQHMPEGREEAFDRAAGLLEAGGVKLFSTYFLSPGEPADGFFHSDRHAHLLFYHRSTEGENAARFGRNGLQVVARMREARVDAFVLRKQS